MSSVFRFALLATLAWLITGCTTPSITNLTPCRLTRKPNGQYLFEAQWESRQQSIVKDTLKGYVVIGLDQYHMERVTNLTNRWETLVPIPAEKEIVTYQFKFDYDYRGMPERRGNSTLSRYHQLEVVDQWPPESARRRPSGLRSPHHRLSLRSFAWAPNGNRPDAS